MKRCIRIAAGLSLLMLAARAEAAGGFVSAGISALSGGSYRCSVYNGDSSKRASILFELIDEDCVSVSQNHLIPPGHHASFSFPASGGFTSPTVMCQVFSLDGPDGTVKRSKLTATFAVEYGGQTSAAIPVNLYLSNVPSCVP